MAAVLTMNQPSRDIFHGYPQHYATDRSRLSYSPSALSSQQFPYGTHMRQQPQQHPELYRHSSSPSFEYGFKPSLPSISNLLDIANTDRPSREAAPLEAPTQRQIQQHIPQATSQRQPSPGAYQSGPMHPPSDASRHRYESPNPYSAAPMHPPPETSHHRYERSISSRLSIPPTPPFRGDSVLEGTQSPSTISSGSSLSTAQPYFLATALNNVEATEQRMPLTQPAKRPSLPSHPSAASASPYATSPYTSSPVTVRTHYSPAEPLYQPPNAGLYQQRPLPSNFPPPPPGPPLPTSTSQQQQQPQGPSPNLWEHHHYISSSSQSSYPPPQDRYICQTCNKAFSRPSSLKIHSHSHTGEKPFKCPHSGCGKAFSVRSNMKRHERGCHARRPGMFPSGSPDGGGDGWARSF